MAARPLFELAWMTGAKHSDGLLPWLDPDSQFQLSRWPSAAALNKSRPLLSLCALMTRRALGRAQLQILLYILPNVFSVIVPFLLSYFTVHTLTQIVCHACM